jgi:hypothetical protein
MADPLGLWGQPPLAYRGRKPQRAADDPWKAATVADNSSARPGKTSESPALQLAVPETLRPRLARWVEIDEVGAAGFWRWLESVLPLLPTKDNATNGSADGVPPTPLRMQELARDLVDCAGDRARLTISCGHYYSDNQALSRRVKALEAALRMFERSGHAPGLGEDAESAETAERYLPHR